MASPVARKLRQSPTDAEVRLWSRLRLKQLDGYRFRRQQPLGRYVVDFSARRPSSSSKSTAGQHVNDTGERTRWLAERGYRVIRFWNNDVLANTDGVLHQIREALRA